MIRIVATADNHLGRYHARMSVSALDTRRRYLRRGFEQACRHAIEQHTDLFLIAGDLFDITAPRNVERTHVAKCLRLLGEAGIPVFAVAGNHDSPRSRTDEGGYCALEVYHEAGLLHFFREPAGDPPQVDVQTLTVRDQRMAIAGFSPNPALSPGEDPLAELSYAMPSTGVRVLLGHFLIADWVHPEAGGALTRPASLEALRDIDLVIAGDLHDFRTARFGGVNVVVPGSTEWMSYRENVGTSPGFVEIRLEPANIPQVQHIPVIPQARVIVNRHISSLDAADPTGSIVAQVRAEMSAVGPDPLVQLRLEGVAERDLLDRLDLVSVAEQLRDQVCHLDLELDALQVRRADGQSVARGARLSLQDEFAAAIAELAMELDGDDRTVLPEVEQEILSVLDSGNRGRT